MAVKRFRRNNIRRGPAKKSFFNVNQVLDSSGPQGKVRGSVSQLVDRYRSLAQDARISGDRVLEESLLQHAEHYGRILAAHNANTARPPAPTTVEVALEDVVEVAEDSSELPLKKVSLSEKPDQDFQLIPVEKKEKVGPTRTRSAKQDT